MDGPTWGRREEWAREEVRPWLDRGLLPPPVLLLFEGDEATVYVRGGAHAVRPGQPPDERMRWNELFALGWALTPEAALLVTSVRLRSDAADDLLSQAEGEAGVGMAWVRRRPDGPDRPPEAGGVLHTYGLDDAGEVTWRERIELAADAELPMGDALTAIVTGRWPADPDAGDDGRRADLGMSPASLAYSLRCFGVTIGVARGWVERYGFDVPVDPRQVRREDRRRAEAWCAGTLVEVAR